MPRHYREVSVAFDDDPLPAAVELVRAVAPADYILYEAGHREWSLGLGIHSRVTVYADRTVLAADGAEQVFKHGERRTAVDAALSNVPVAGWRVYGTADFELARHLYGLKPQDPAAPLAKMFVPEAEVRFSDNSVLLRALDGDALDRLRRCLDSVLSSENGRRPAPAARKLHLPEIAAHDAGPYRHAVAAALAEIRSHQYRKVILSRRVPIPPSIDMAQSFVAGRRANTPARSYMLCLDGLRAAGFSPETVVEVDEAGEVRTTPLAGTRSTGADVTEELVLREELVSDSKEIAEHAISVYVAFDELTMVCHPTSVVVSNFMIVSRRGTVQHLASSVKGTLLTNCSAWDAFSALFPAVTASGVPKWEAVEAIGRFERQSRGLYSGCVMIADESGRFDAALVLRSFFQQDGRTWLQAGAGIMNMSTPERELEETREKLASVSNHLVPMDDG